ncbi:protein of unknown function (plasmid) [Agrobacterium pusense]|uniref:Uncharacterized protein n=1 Tax=Agrobacterium pusense TaxID=648995 RepID=U4Q336_9HYPH|nr:protein of unknown function [Agrobacterium pusense]
MRKNSQPLGSLTVHHGHDLRRKPCQLTRFPPSGLNSFVTARDFGTALYTRVLALEVADGPPGEEWLLSTLLLGPIPGQDQS